MGPRLVRAMPQGEGRSRPNERPNASKRRHQLTWDDVGFARSRSDGMFVWRRNRLRCEESAPRTKPYSYADLRQRQERRWRRWRRGGALSPAALRSYCGMQWFWGWAAAAVTDADRLAAKRAGAAATMAAAAAAESQEAAEWHAEEVRDID